MTDIDICFVKSLSWRQELCQSHGEKRENTTHAGGRERVQKRGKQQPYNQWPSTIGGYVWHTSKTETWTKRDETFRESMPTRKKNYLELTAITSRYRHPSIQSFFQNFALKIFRLNSPPIQKFRSNSWARTKRGTMSRTHVHRFYDVLTSPVGWWWTARVRTLPGAIYHQRTTVCAYKSPFTRHLLKGFYLALSSFFILLFGHVDGWKHGIIWNNPNHHKFQGTAKDVWVWTWPTQLMEVAKEVRCKIFKVPNDGKGEDV